MSPDIKRMSTDTTEAEVQARVDSLRTQDLNTCIHGNPRFPRKHADRCPECKATDPGPDAILLDAESARDQQRRHEEKAAYHEHKAKTHREKAERFAHYAELADQGRPVVFKERA